MERIGEWLLVEKLDRPKGRKTDTWKVLSTTGSELGKVHWFGRWRQYTFSPLPETTFNRDCLIHIAAFLYTVNEQHRSRRK